MNIEPVDTEVPDRVAEAFNQISVILDGKRYSGMEEDLANVIETNHLSFDDRQMLFRLRYAAPIPYVSATEIEHMSDLCFMHMSRHDFMV